MARPPKDREQDDEWEYSYIEEEDQRHGAQSKRYCLISNIMYLLISIMVKYNSCIFETMLIQPNILSRLLMEDARN